MESWRERSLSGRVGGTVGTKDGVREMDSLPVRLGLDRPGAVSAPGSCSWYLCGTPTRTPRHSRREKDATPERLVW